jgi:elongation factor 3
VHPCEPAEASQVAPEPPAAAAPPHARATMVATAPADKPAPKPAAAIRVVHRAAKPGDAAAAAGAANYAAAAGAPKAATPKGARSPAKARGPSPEEAWAALLAEAGGDLPEACAAFNRQVAGGSTAAAAACGALVDYCGVRSLEEEGILVALTGALEAGEGVSAPARLAALAALAALARAELRGAEPYLLQLLPAALAAAGDRAPEVAAAGGAAAAAVGAALHGHATRAAADAAAAVFRDTSARPAARVAALDLVAARAARYAAETGRILPSLIPRLAEAAVDGRPEVAAAADAALRAAVLAAGNRDLEAHAAALAACVARPGEVPDLVARLSATTFVQAVDAATLAVVAPILGRALRERSGKTQRRAAVIAENMGKLVTEPAGAAPFLPLLLPGLQAVAAQAADPELREVAGRARDGLAALEAEAATATAAAAPATTAGEAAAAVAAAAAAAAAPGVDLATPFAKTALAYAGALAASALDARVRTARSWEVLLAPALEPLVGGPAEGAAAAAGARKWALGRLGAAADADAGGPNELCNCEFSLAYGGRILLTNATLRLERGRRYGLCGTNGVGKSTLMKAIAAGQLDGFPPADELRTVYVAHDMDASDSQVACAAFIHEDATVQAAVAPTRAQVDAALEAVGFDAALRAAPLAALSGGWKMKLALARAMLMRADVLLLDEPTNHLDVANVQWLQNYLTSRPDISSLVVSHDSGFLDAVCTDIIHYEQKKLVLYPGSLEAFVAAHPEAKAYYELKAADPFKFPDPGFLDGIKGKSQSVMKMTGVAFTYPGAAKPQLEGVTLRVTLGSRVALLGANGAGKTTLVRMLTGDSLPSAGAVWKHPNLRLAYVAQHAFHHIEAHLDSSPSEYIWWRFGGGGDEEAKQLATRRVTDEERAARAEAAAAGKRVVEEINSRRMGKTKEYEYEIKWVGQSQRENSWIARSTLCGEMGLGKLVEEKDAELAAYRLYRPLSREVVLSHLADFGLDEEVACHNRIRGLSGGQKVRLVLAAAMWPQPHVLVLDEPTNYLDREALGALAAGVAGFAGGVLMISHNREFTSALAREEWLVEGGRVTARGGMTSAPSSASLVSSASALSLAESAAESAADSAFDEEGLTEEELEARLAQKAMERASKAAIAAEKAEKKALRAKLKFAKRF